VDEDPLLTPRTDLWGAVRSRRARRPTSAWGGGALLLGLAAVVFPILLLALTRL
jgi:hypothetical protein